MAIPEGQLETWASQGSITQSSETYAAIRKALEHPDAPFANRTFKIFLQGSYANATNIFADSDVDLVVQLDDCFYFDETALPAQMQADRTARRATASYGVTDFQRDVLVQLRHSFEGVTPGPKAVFLPAGGARRDADVLVAATFRRFFLPPGMGVHYTEGLCFFAGGGERIVNYPRLHAARCTAKHQATHQWFKPTVRIFKNLRNRAVRDRRLGQDRAPSYYLEGLLHNVPDDLFGGSYAETVRQALIWISKADPQGLLCANGQVPLVRDGSSVSWSTADFEAFRDAAIQTWNNWGWI